MSKRRKNIRFDAANSDKDAQVVADTAGISWQFNFTANCSDLDDLYVEWLLGWSQENKRKPNSLVSMTLDANGMALKSITSKRMHYALNTGIANQTKFEFQFRGFDLFDVIGGLRSIDGAQQLSFRGHNGGILVVEATDSLATYSVAMPTADDEGGYIDMYFGTLIGPHEVVQLVS